MKRCRCLILLMKTIQQLQKNKSLHEQFLCLWRIKLLSHSGGTMNQRIEKDELINLLPHKGKMFLLSRVTSYDIENFSITVETDVTEDFIFYEEELGGIPNWSTFEVMAQGISALTGIYDRIHNIESKAGCIVSVSAFKSDTDVFKVGTTVKATAIEEYRDEESGIYRYNCAVYVSPSSQDAAVTATVTVMKVEDLESLSGI